ncbi:MAG TPA: C2 family cysteine protease [Gemmata sp.]|nr:C2 family cysteine protease [Gemmata sp.]
MVIRSLVLSLVLVSPVALSAAGDPKQNNSIADVITDHFQKWDKQGTGKLTREEVDGLVANHSVKGDVAAAVAALHVYFRNNPTAGPLTQTFVLESASKSLPAERRDLANKFQHFQADYEHFRNHIQNSPRDLFVGDAPQLQGVHQGGLGDCYFVSMVGAAIHFERNRLKQIFHPIKDGVCELDFLDGTKTTVKLTDAQIALGSSAGAQGLWLNVLEEGFGQVRFKQQPKKEPGDIPIDVISRGGSPAASISLLTGHKAEQLDVLKHAKEPAATRKLRDVMISGTKSRLLMGAGTPDEKEQKLPPGVAGGHCYAVLGFDQAKDIVHLWNPWGNNFQPKKEPAGLENGYPVKDGLFDVPLGDFLKFFGYFNYETHEPIKPIPKKK